MLTKAILKKIYNANINIYFISIDAKHNNSDQ